MPDHADPGRAADRPATGLREAVTSLYVALERRDTRAVLALVSPDVVVTQTSLLPWGGTFRGLEGYARFGAGVYAHLASRVTVEHIIEAGEEVVVLGRTAGTVSATGVPFDLAIVHSYTFAGDRIVRAHIVIDTPAMLAVLDQEGGTP